MIARIAGWARLIGRDAGDMPPAANIPVGTVLYLPQKLRKASLGYTQDISRSWYLLRWIGIATEDAKVCAIVSSEEQAQGQSRGYSSSDQHHTCVRVNRHWFAGS
ncbi:hypothetical protein B0H14DRAFT_2606135 [Mycena olivaceomarginata]|nr:hypothetical protein B0H14DRAFT_2606135 [Mycena olivaceomarginata]